MEKNTVRALAERFRLPVAEKRDSQGVCFLGSVSVDEFLRAEFGSDNPALLYTLGQRVPRPGGPWYVVGKDVEKKKIVVSKTPVSSARSIQFRDANWLQESREIVEAQYRYRGPHVAGRLESATFESNEPLPEIPTPGQSIVFYKDTELVGGGIITL
jgi:tRNA-specific 2-thiouridylase